MRTPTHLGPGHLRSPSSRAIRIPVLSITDVHIKPPSGAMRTGFISVSTKGLPPYEASFYERSRTDFQRIHDAVKSVLAGPPVAPAKPSDQTAVVGPHRDTSGDVTHVPSKRKASMSAARPRPRC